MISSLRSALQPRGFLRFFIFAIFTLGALRREILRALGFADTGLPLWVAASLLTALFLVYVMLSTNEPLSLAVAGRARGVRTSYSAFFLLVLGAFMTAVWVRVPITSPLLLVSAALLVPLCALDLLPRRNRASAR